MSGLGQAASAVTGGKVDDEDIPSSPQEAAGAAARVQAGMASGGMSEAGGVGEKIQAGGTKIANGDFSDLSNLVPKGAEGADWSGYENRIGEHFGDTMKSLEEMKKSGEDYGKQQAETQDSYLGKVNPITNNYKKDVNTYKTQAEDQAKDAQNTYTQTILPKFKDLMERSGSEAGSAMTLGQSADPNNAVAVGARNLYNEEGAKQQKAFADQAAAERARFKGEGNDQRAAYAGQAAATQDAYQNQGKRFQDIYEQQAQGAGKQGLADAGVLNALGAQAMSEQMGGASPLTGGQLQAMAATSQQAGGAAYARAQQQMNRLREQGLGARVDRESTGLDTGTQFQGQGLGVASQMAGQGLGVGAGLGASGVAAAGSMGAQGIGQGYTQSGEQYGRGQQAQQAALQMSQGYEGAFGRGQGVQKDLRGEQYGLSHDLYGTAVGQAATVRDVNTAKEQQAYGNTSADQQRRLAASNARYGDMQALDAAQQGEAAAARGGMFGALGTVGGGILGGYFGGPAGAAAGASVGGSVGGGLGGGQGNFQAPQVNQQLPNTWGGGGQQTAAVAPTGNMPQGYQPMNPYGYGNDAYANYG